MALAHSPSIVMSGLVLCLDAANRKSYSGSGTAWTDLSATGNNGSLQNSPTFDINNKGSFSFDGANNRVLINCVTNTVRTFDSSCFFVIKLPVYSGGQRCILSYRSGGAGDLYVGKGSSGIFCYYNNWNTPAYTVGSIVDNSIAICCVTLDATNNTVSTYINGSLTGSATRTGWSSSYGSSMYLGYDAGGTNEYMLGNFYFFAHYNRVLTAQQVQQNFQALRGRYGI